MKITDEHVHDSKALPGLIGNIIKSDSMTTTSNSTSSDVIDKLFADIDAYEGNDIFRY